jgi:capsular polysaccharide biosynthesis protein
MIDSLPQFIFREKFAKFSMPILFSQSKEPFQKDTLKLLLHKNYPIYETYYRVLMRECAFTWPLRRTTAVDFLRKKSLHVAPDNSIKRIYVSRRHALFRQVRNETELEPILKKYGFTIIDCENITLTKQVSLFKSADIVCGPHGAGLTNIAFCKSNASVLEIIMEERLSTNVGSAFWELACAANLDYHIVSGSRIPVDETNEVDGAMYLDPQKFEAALAHLISNRK